jgi:hypothetical protein
MREIADHADRVAMNPNAANSMVRMVHCFSIVNHTDHQSGMWLRSASHPTIASAGRSPDEALRPPSPKSSRCSVASGSTHPQTLPLVANPESVRSLIMGHHRIKTKWKTGGRLLLRI